MKIISDGAVYVQKNDIAYLNSTDLSIPVSIFMKVFGFGLTFIDDSNRYYFIKYEEDSEIEYLKGLDWMIDYNEVKDLSDDEIISLGQSIADKKNSIASKFNAMSNEEKNNNIDMITECDL